MIEVYVKGQNAVVEFPDGMPENEIHSVMEKHFGGGSGAEASGPSPLFAIDEPGTLGERISKAAPTNLPGPQEMAPRLSPRAAEESRLEASAKQGFGRLEALDELTRAPLEKLLPEEPAPGLLRGRNKYEDSIERGMHGALRGVLGAASFFTSGEGIGAIRGAQAAPRLTGMAFATEGARGIGPAVVEAQEAIRARDPGRIGKSLVDVPMNLLMLGAGPGKMVKDFGEKGKIVRATPGERGITPGVDETAGEHGGFRQFILGGPKAIVEKSKFLEGKKLEREQVLGRLENLAQKGELSPAELGTYKEGLRDFLTEAPRTTKEIADKMDELAPQVEVKVLSSGGDPELKTLIQQQGELSHKLDTLHPQWWGIDKYLLLDKNDGDTISIYDTKELAERARLRSSAPDRLEVKASPEPTPEVRALTEEYYRTEKKVATLKTSNVFDPDQYRSIAPKDADQDVVMVRVPLRTTAKATGGWPEVKERPLHQGGHWGAEDKNVLGWARIQWEKTVEGKKVAHIIEVQSDWGQRQRELARNPEDATGYERTAKTGHPLLKDYPRLTLKAAIDYARKNGADAVALSDAQTAMMSEGHDAVASAVHPTTALDAKHEAGFSGRDVEVLYGPDWREGRYVAMKNRGVRTGATIYRVDKPEANPKENIETARDLIPYANKEGQHIPQEGGMRLNYDPNIMLVDRKSGEIIKQFAEKDEAVRYVKYMEDRGVIPRDSLNPKTGGYDVVQGTLHQTLEELTGRKGEPVDFGEHQRAREPRPLYNEETGERGIGQLRQNLIFKDTSGKPKTTATARLYDISHLREKQFSLFGKDVERTSPVGRPSERGAIEWNPLARWQGIRKKGGGGNARRPQAEEGQRLLGSVGMLAGGGGAGNPPPGGPTQASAASSAGSVRSWLERRGLKGDTIPAAWDVNENSANVYSKQTRNWIESKGRDTFGRKMNKFEQEALSFVVEAKGNIKNLDAMRDELAGVNTRWARRAKSAIALAGQQWGRLVPVAERFVQEARRQVDAENIRGIDTIYREGYVPHMWDLREELDLLFESGGGGASGFMKQRKYDTLAQAIAAGKKPVSLNAFDLIEHRLRVGNKMAGKAELVESLKKVNDPFTGKAIFADIDRAVRQTPTGPRGSQAVVPKGYVATFFGNQPVAVLKQYSGLFKALNGESIFNENVLGRVLMKGVGASKHAILLFDLYHMGRLAYYGMSIGGFRGMRFNKGISLLDFDEATLGDMVRRGDISAKWVKDIVEEKRIIGLGLRTGFNVGRIADNLFPHFMEKLPLLGRYNKFLFGRFQRGIMARCYILEFRRLKEANPGKTDAEIARSVSRDLNIRFGNLMNQSWVKNKSLQDLMRVFLLAPQWNEGLMRTELGAMGQTGGSVFTAATERRLVVGSLMKSAGNIFAWYFVANQIINMWTRGHPTWDNPEEGMSAKISAWIPDKLGSSKGMFLNPLSLTAEISHQISKQIEKRQSWRRGLHDFVSFKLSTAGRFLDLLWTGENWKGKNLTDAEVLKEAALMAPIPMQVPTVYHAWKGKEEYPGEAQKTAFGLVGIKPEIIQPPQTGGIKRTGVSRNATRRKAIRR